MKKHAQSHTTEHPNDLLLPYVEGLLDPTEKEMVEDHLKACALCAAEVEQLRETIALLGAHRDAFCPEDWELYEHVHYGTDPDGLISRHVQHCQSCRQIVEELSAQISPEQMPDRLWDSIRQQAPFESRMPLPAQLDSESFLDRVSRMFRFPAIAVGVATAAVLGFVLLRTPDMPQSVVALSSVAWEKAPKPKALHASDKNAAIILVLKDFDPPWPKERIDRLYEALVPPVEVYDRFRILSPAAIKESLGRSGLKARETGSVVAALAKGLSLTTVVVVTVTARGQAASVQVDVIDTSSGRLTMQKAAAYVPGGNLDSTARQLTLDALLSHEKGTQTRSAP